MLIKFFESDKPLTKQEAYKKIVDFFVEQKITTPKYLDGILAREKQATFYIGNHIAIPHGAYEFQSEILSDGICGIRFKNAIDWDGQKVHYVIGIAASGGNQIDVLSNIAVSFSDVDEVLDSFKIPADNLAEALEWN